jgi:hypothetical protein
MKKKNAHRVVVRNLKEDYLEDISQDGRLMLK